MTIDGEKWTVREKCPDRNACALASKPICYHLGGACRLCNRMGWWEEPSASCSEGCVSDGMVIYTNQVRSKIQWNWLWNCFSKSTCLPCTVLNPCKEWRMQPQSCHQVLGVHKHPLSEYKRAVRDWMTVHHLLIRRILKQMWDLWGDCVRACEEFVNRSIELTCRV